MCTLVNKIVIFKSVIFNQKYEKIRISSNISLSFIYRLYNLVCSIVQGFTEIAKFSPILNWVELALLSLSTAYSVCNFCIKPLQLSMQPLQYWKSTETTRYKADFLQTILYKQAGLSRATLKISSRISYEFPLLNMNVFQNK